MAPVSEYMKDDFFVKTEKWHKPDLGSSDNVHKLDPETWKDVEVAHIDIANRNQVEPGNCRADEDPALSQSIQIKSCPLGPNWKQEKRISSGFHRQRFCWIDRWINLSVEDIWQVEDETRRELEVVGLRTAAPSVGPSWLTRALRGQAVEAQWVTVKEESAQKTPRASQVAEVSELLRVWTRLLLPKLLRLLKGSQCFSPE